MGVTSSVTPAARADLSVAPDSSHRPGSPGDAHAGAGERAPRPNRLRTGPVRPLLAPLWYGCEVPGVDQAPAAIEAGLRDRWCERDEPALAARLLETVTVEVPAVPDALRRRNHRDFAFLPAIAAHAGALADAAAAAVREGALALTIGGDHAVAAGSVAGVARATREMTGPDGQPGRLGLIWVDTHADLNTPETSPSGHVHGLPMASLLGAGPDELTGLAGGGPAVLPGDVCLLGVRDLDPGERRMIRERGIWARTMEEWDDVGLRDGLREAFEHLRERGVTAVHLSFDLDVIDPVDLPATGTTCPGGLTSREAARVIRMLRDSDLPVVGADIVELDVTRDRDGLYLWTTVILLATLLGETQR